MVRTSPQQILDHLGQSEKYDGHELKDQQLKYESIRAVHMESKERYRVRRDRKEFAWYVCVPQEEARSLCPGGSVTNNNKINKEFSAKQVESSTQEQADGPHVHEDFPHGPKHGKMLTDGFSAVPG